MRVSAKSHHLRQLPLLYHFTVKCQSWSGCLYYRDRDAVGDLDAPVGDLDAPLIQMCCVDPVGVYTDPVAKRRKCGLDQIRELIQL